MRKIQIPIIEFPDEKLDSLEYVFDQGNGLIIDQTRKSVDLESEISYPFAIDSALERLISGLIGRNIDFSCSFYGEFPENNAEILARCLAIADLCQESSTSKPENNMNPLVKKDIIIFNYNDVNDIFSYDKMPHADYGDELVILAPLLKKKRKNMEIQYCRAYMVTNFQH